MMVIIDGIEYTCDKLCSCSLSTCLRIGCEDLKKAPTPEKMEKEGDE